MSMCCSRTRNSSSGIGTNGGLQEFDGYKFRLFNNVVISVQDNGIGIPEDMKDQVFDMFFKATEQSNGFGLGLYEANLIIKKLKGNIQINLARKDITEVTIELPIQYQT
jgi:signal transduction histidine kinase